MCIAATLQPDYKEVLNEYEENFAAMFMDYKLNMTLKGHVVVHHFVEYFELTGKTMKETNGEFVETLHSSLRKHEETHMYKVVRKMGTPQHVSKSLRSLTSYNSGRAGYSPSNLMIIRRPSPQSTPPSLL